MERSLAWRLGLGSAMIPALIALFVIDYQLGEAAPFLFLFCMFLTLRSAWEMCRLLTVRQLKPQFLVVATGCIALMLAAWWQHLPGRSVDDGNSIALAPVGLVMSLCVLLVLAAEAIRFRGPGHSMESIGANLLAIAYAGFLLAITAQLRWMAGGEHGYLLLGSLIVATKVGDIGGYAAGRLFGRTKMSPYLSPGKTWAGCVGAIVGAMLGTVLWLTFGVQMFDGISKPPAVWACLMFGGIIGLVGLIGDLCESLIKRDVGQKDSAPLMPGFGGLLDILDSILFAGPVACLLWYVLPLKTW
ncbi:MAG: phosphatidate cytidylyltransferase [Planctomycetaceae bacterium]